MVDGWAVALIVTGAFTVIGWLVARLTTQNEVIRTQNKTIEAQDRTITTLEIAGQLTEKMYRALPPPGGPTP